MIAILDYEAGNQTSVKRALDALGAESIITADPALVGRADRVIFPGVGAAGATMRALKTSGLDAALKAAVASGKPVLGICVGCQVILNHSEENNAACLGFIPGRTRAFDPDMLDQDGRRLKVPHMGWNKVDFQKDHPLFTGVPEGAEFYFVHGYYPAPEAGEHVHATTEYGLTFPSIIGRDNLVAVQFHVEKSGRPGLAMLGNFAAWRP